MFGSSPELLSLLPFVETLEDNEAITAGALNCYSIIHDLKKRAVLQPHTAATKVHFSISLFFLPFHSLLICLWGCRGRI